MFQKNLKQNINFYFDEFDGKPKRDKRTKNTKSKQVSFYELDYDDDFKSNKRKKNVNYK